MKRNEVWNTKYLSSILRFVIGWPLIYVSFLNFAVNLLSIYWIIIIFLSSSPLTSNDPTFSVYLTNSITFNEEVEKLQLCRKRMTDVVRYRVSFHVCGTMNKTQLVLFISNFSRFPVLIKRKCIYIYLLDFDF